MARRGHSQADRDLIDVLAADGRAVSGTQLERWRGAGLLPRPVRRGLGRGRGSTSEYPMVALDVASVLADVARQGRNRHLAALALFVARLPVDGRSLRAAMSWAVRRDRARAIGRHDDVESAAAMARRKVGRYPPPLFVYDLDDLSRREADTRADERRRLQDAAELATLLRLDPDPLTADAVADFMDLIGFGESVEEARESMRAAELNGNRIAPWADINPDDAAIRRLDRAGNSELDDARDVAQLCAAGTAMLKLSAIFDLDARQLLLEIHTNPAYAGLRDLEFATTDNPTPIVWSTAMLLGHEDTMTSARWYAESVTSRAATHVKALIDAASANELRPA